MFQSDPLAEKASAILFQNTEQHLEALLAEHGVRDSSELPRPLQLQLLERAMIGAAATTFPTGNLEMLQHGLRSASHPAFVSAMERMALSCRSAGDAFEMARGVHAAIVLAGWGLPVAPFDLEAMCIRAKPSRDIDTVQALFSADKGAYVGYSSCDAPFYLLQTDCISTLRQLVALHPRRFGAEAAGCPPRRFAAAGSRASLQTRDRCYHSPGRRYNFDRRADRSESAGRLDHIVCRLASGR